MYSIAITIFRTPSVLCTVTLFPHVFHSPLLLLQRDKLHLAPHAQRQLCNLDTTPRGLVGREKLGVELVECGKVIHGLEEDLCRGIALVSFEIG